MAIFIVAETFVPSELEHFESTAASGKCTDFTGQSYSCTVDFNANS